MTTLLGLILLPAILQVAPAHYRVSLDANLRTAHVVATFPSGATRLLMDSVQADQLPRGWATFVRILAVEAGGRAVTVTPGDGAWWEIPVGASAPVTLRYEVDLGFTRVPWPAGNEQAGAAFDNGVYLVGRSVFVVSDRTTRSEVTFDVPSGWRVSTPLAASGGDGRTFVAQNVSDLVRNGLVVGAHALVRVNAGPFDLELALPGPVGAAAPLVEPVLRRVVAGYLPLFPDTPPQKYLMTFFRAPADDGEAFTGSATFTTTDSITSEGVIVWGNFLAHELMHFWNGQRIRGAGPRSTWRWMAEGFTEYYANVVLARQGIVSTGMFVKKAERHLGNYLYFATAPALPRMSLAEAGTNTGANRFGVYDGGWTVALCLDGLIRERSGDRRSLDDFMRELWRRFGARQRAYTTDDLSALAEEMAGTSLGSFLSTAVESVVVLPVRDCLRRVGFSAAFKGYAAEAFVFEAPAATPAEQARGRAIFGRTQGR